MAYQPQFTITASLLSKVEAVAALRERILGAAVELTWIPALQKDTSQRRLSNLRSIINVLCYQPDHIREVCCLDSQAGRTCTMCPSAGARGCFFRYGHERLLEIR